MVSSDILFFLFCRLIVRFCSVTVYTELCVSKLPYLLMWVSGINSIVKGILSQYCLDVKPLNLTIWLIIKCDIKC